MNLNALAMAFSRATGLRLVRNRSFENLLEQVRQKIKQEEHLKYLHLLTHHSDNPALLNALANSNSQIAQDVHAWVISGFRAGGYFVEFGAAGGIEGSNTYLLEKNFGWKGIVAEPARVWHTTLKANRRCNVDTRCVWRQSGELLTFEELPGGYLSGVQQTKADPIAGSNVETYPVETISLFDLLKHYDAPKQIDYLSIDTEGSEFEILETFPFDTYSFNFITVEHNRTPIRKDIERLLMAHKYQRLPIPWGFEDWYYLQK
jgi:FkbM family methyltransferase